MLPPQPARFQSEHIIVDHTCEQKEMKVPCNRITKKQPKLLFQGLCFQVFGYVRM